MSSTKVKQLAILLAVPLLACAVFARQVYLQVAHDLSVWKGGGMGMFAGVGAPQHRFVKIFLTDPLGQRILTVRHAPEQVRLIAAVRAEPTQANLEELAGALLESRWILRRETIAGYRVDSRGRRIGLMPERHLSVVPATAPTRSDERLTPGNGGWTPERVQIEFWEIGYDRDSKTLRATRAKAFEKPRAAGPG